MLSSVLRRPPPSPLFPYTTLFRSLSSGATAALELAIAHPDRIAAVVPVSFTAIPSDLRRMKDVPAWIFHDSGDERVPDRKSTRLNSSHTVISYAVFCLKKKTSPVE